MPLLGFRDQLSALSIQGAEQKDAVSAPINARPPPTQMAGIYGLFVAQTEITPRYAWALYENVATLAKVVDLIADQVAGLRPLFLSNGLPVAPAAEKALNQFFGRPGFNRDRRRLIKELAVQMLVTGTGYLAAYGNPRMSPAALDVLKSMYVNPLQGSGMWPSEYNYTEGMLNKYFTIVGASDFRWIDENGLAELVPIYDMDGTRRGIGLSRLSAVKMDVELRLAGTEHNTSLLQNGARPTGALSFKEALTVEQREDIKLQLREGMAGTRNAGKMFVFGAGEAEFLQMSQSAKDMDWSNLVKLVEDAIVARYNVPITLYNVSAQTDNNYETAWMQFYDNSVLPTFDIIWGGIARLLQDRMGVDLSVKHDTLANNTLAKQAANRATQLKSGNLITTNEARTLIGYEPIIGGDIISDPLGQPMEDYFTDPAEPGEARARIAGPPRPEPVPDGKPDEKRVWLQ